MLCGFLAFAILQATRYEASVVCCKWITTVLVGEHFPHPVQYKVAESKKAFSFYHYIEVN